MIDDFKKTAEAVTLHGLGFLQIQLQANQRLHVWHPDLPRRKCFHHSSIHDHRFAFTSLVLVGTQVNTEYYCTEPNESNKLPPSHVIYLHEGDRTKFGNRPWIPDGERFFQPQSPKAITAGKTYEMYAYVYHSTTPGGNGKVATLMTKTFEDTKGAHSACAIGITPDVDFDRKQWSEDRLWEIVRDVLTVPA